MGRTMHLLHERVQAMDNLQVGQPTIGTSTALQTHPQRHMIPDSEESAPLKFIRQLETHIPQLLADMHIDYFKVSTKCYSMLRQTYTALMRSPDYNADNLKGGSNPDREGLVDMVIDILKQNADEAKKVKPGEIFRCGVALEIAAQVFEETCIEEVGMTVRSRKKLSKFWVWRYLQL